MISKNGASALTGSAYSEKAEFEFLRAMEDKFGKLNVIPVADGAIQRFHVPGDRATRNGWYVLHQDGVAWGVFGSWRTGEKHGWNNGRSHNPLDVALMRQRVEQARRKSEAMRAQLHRKAAERANQLWQKARRADPNHPYLIAKGCQPHNLRQLRGLLLVPLYFEGVLVNLQRIRADGRKWFLPDGRVKGCYSPLGEIKPSEPLYVCEGWATGATLYEDQGHPVACAMSAGNLLHVGRSLKSRHPEAALTLAGDDDRLTECNPGRTMAVAAAEALGCGYVLPLWPADAPTHLSDVNDLRQWKKGAQ